MEKEQKENKESSKGKEPGAPVVVAGAAAPGAEAAVPAIKKTETPCAGRMYCPCAGDFQQYDY